MIEKLEIKKFRGFENIDIEFSKVLTAIVGRNGTSKTTVLGMLAQSFDYSGNRKTIHNEKFASQFSNNFKFSRNYKKYEDSGNHEFSVYFDNEECSQNSKVRSDRTPKKKSYNEILKLLNDIKVTEVTKENFEGTIEKISSLTSEYEGNTEKLKEKTITLQKQIKAILTNNNLYDLNQKLNLIENNLKKIRENEKEEWTLRLTNRNGSVKHRAPLIYLGLDRLIPLGSVELEDVTYGKLMEDGYQKQFSELFSEIFVLNEKEKIKNVKEITIPGKKTSGGENEIHDELGVSVGQDNLSKIIISILSFERLKDKYKDYDGGILLIDELEASLHPAAQRKLIDILDRKGRELNLQIIFTTHSLVILEKMYNKIKNKSKDNDDYRLIGLDKRGVKIVPIEEQSHIYNSLMLSGRTIDKKKKINVYTEDSKARDFLRHILDENQLEKIELVDINFTNGGLKSLAKYGLPDLKNSILFVDGDSREFLDSQLENLCILPVDVALEKELYNFLETLEDENEFWITSGDDHYYTKEIFLNDSIKNKNNDKVDQFKKWFSRNEKFFEKRINILYKEWKNCNEETVENFKSEFSKKINENLDQLIDSKN